MNAALHPARVLDFDVLVGELEAARAAGLVYRRDDPATGRSLYCYTSRCVYETAWTAFTMLARGLILDRAARRVIATPFPKFFNAGEGGRTIPDLPFESFEKLDGSLAIIHFQDGRWRATTKGAFDSDQALWAEARLAAQDLSALEPGTTYLAEAVSPENRIVIRYEESALVLLAAYAEDGSELSYEAILDVAARLGWRAAQRQAYGSIAELMAEARRLPRTEEGFVIRFADGTRFKLKGDEYRRIHALISRCTPLAMWDAMVGGDDLPAIRHDLPEEFWEDFDSITALLQAQYESWRARIAEAAAKVAALSDKELGLALAGLDPATRPYLFAFRKSGGTIDERTRQKLLREIRPTGNELAGYIPSYAMGRMMEELL